MVLSRSLSRIRSSARSFARAPGLSFALLLTIALGIGSNSAIYGFLQGLTHPASPLRGFDRIVSIFREDRFRDAGPLSASDYQMLKKSSGAFDWIGAVRIRPSNIVIGTNTEIATVAAATPNLAVALTIPLDDGVVVSHHVWESEFGGGANVVGSKIRIDNVDYKIKGIAPDQLDGLYSDRSVDLWIPLQERDLQGGGDRQEFWVLARLRDGISARRAQTALRSGSSSGISVTPFTGIAPNMARGLSRIDLFLSFSAGAVFFIACINVASLLLGRALRRSHETSLRIALGAARAELLWELFSDSIVISIAGGALGLLLAILTAHAIPAFLFEEDAERLSFAPHLLPILTASLACVVITVICGMMPVLGTVTDRPWIVLQRETGSPSKAIRRLRSGLVVAQITACCMLVICTALLLDGLHAALETSAGHRLGDPILLTVQRPEAEINYFNEVEEKAKSVAGLSPLAWTTQLPGSQPMWQTFRVQPPPSQYRDVAMDIAWLTPESLNLLDSQPIAGRMFGANDPTRRVAIVDEDAAAKLFGLQTAGVVIEDSAGFPIEIIGVVKRKSTDAIQQSDPTIYYGYVDQSNAPSPMRHAQFRVPVALPPAGIELDANAVSANYFDALNLPLIAGRKFSAQPIPGMGRVGVINQEAANLFFNGKPLGAGVIDDRGVRTEIIGVVKSQVFGTFEKHAEPTIYFPMWQDCPTRMTLIFKEAKRNSGTLADLRRKIGNALGYSAAPMRINTLSNQLAQSGLAALRIATLIGSMSAATALILSILGLLSAQSDAEYQRQHEHALRIALGAQRRHIVFLVVVNASRLALIGTVAGTFLSFALLRLLMADIAVVASPQFQVWLIAPLLPAAMVILASMIPAWRAALISPLVVMRDR
ncbi:ABC transporter permease [Acidicapsa dinghuensis]|uniref:ABC transporter permease n=1 Tax=Acidicapsa dinghuensis TaxID=2218256 RepID=A0ABW1ENP7_9BACT|nr:ABC transporter permease [Acidicapsa dinghuensis]